MASILKSLTMQNFGPFAEPITFTTVADSSKKELLENNTFVLQDNLYNKISYIFGANGAGKSNFCKAILQIQNLLTMAPILSSNNQQLIDMSQFSTKNPTLKNYFKFNRVYEDKPSSFSLEVVMDGIIYTYSFATLKDKIVSERLTKKYRRTEIILDRTSPTFDSIQLKSELKSFANNVSVVKENVLCLSMAAFLNVEFANKLVYAIQSIEVVNMAVSGRLANITEETCTEERIKKYISVLQFIDPTLKDIHIKFNEEKVERQKMNTPDLEDREFIVRSVKVDVVSTHSIFDGVSEVETHNLPFLQFESNGTIKMLGILPVIFNALESGGVVIIDEIENGLHPIVVNQIVALFRDNNTNPYNAQLICTTHSQSLINKDVRRDQIWVINKNKYGVSSIERISNIPGIRAYENNGQKYLENAFGEIPQSIFQNY